MSQEPAVPYHNEHLKLLAYLAERLGLKSDSEIAQALEIEASSLSRIRNGKQRLPSRMLLRILDRLNLRPSDLKSLFGISPYLTFVWGAEPNASTLSFKALDADPVWAKQTEVITVLTTMVRQYGYAILKAGQRSGMSVIAARVANRLSAEHIYLFAHSMAVAEVFPEYVDVSLNTLPVSAEHALPNSLVVIDQAWDRPNQLESFREALKLNLPVLVAGSCGPEWDANSAWKLYPHALSYNVWDINPHLTRAALQPYYDEDATMAARNFEAF